MKATLSSQLFSFTMSVSILTFPTVNIHYSDGPCAPAMASQVKSNVPSGPVVSVSPSRVKHCHKTSLNEAGSPEAWGILGWDLRARILREKCLHLLRW